MPAWHVCCTENGDAGPVRGGGDRSESSHLGVLRGITRAISGKGLGGVTQTEEHETIRQTKRIQSQLAASSAASRAFGGPSDPSGIARAIYNTLAGLLEAPICFLALYDRAAQNVEIVWQLHYGLELPGGSFPLGNGFTSRVIRTRQPLLIRRWRAEGPPVQVQYATDEPALPESSITAPILFGDHVLGVVSLQDYRPEAFDEDDLALLQAIANGAAPALGVWAASERRTGNPAWPEPQAGGIRNNISDARLVVDDHGKIVRLNTAARLLLCSNGASIILGQPLDLISDDLCPLGQARLAEKLGPMVADLNKGRNPPDVDVELGGEQRRTFNIRGTTLRTGGGAPLGGVIVFQEIERPKLRA